MVRSRLAFYPTYEEWKQEIFKYVNQKDASLFILPMRNGNEGGKTMEEFFKDAFYPTYEEWKLICYRISYCMYFTFYPTYEEWKHFKDEVHAIAYSLFILPMRNGNV